MRVQGAATGLLLRDAHNMPVPFEKAHRRALGIAESLTHDAAGEEAHVGAFTIDATEGSSFGRRRQRGGPAETTRQCPCGKARETGTGTEVGEARHEREAPRTGDCVERRAGERAAVFALPQHLARAFHDPTERHTGGACCLARTAHQARLEVTDSRLARRRRGRDDRADQLNASARRIGLVPEHAIGRAIVEAEAARDARREVLGVDRGGRESDVPSIRTMAIGAASIAARLREVVSPDRVIDDPATLLPYSYDASFWSLRQRRRPSAVVVPESTAEVVAVVGVANETETPLVPRGAGTGQTGGAIAPEGGIVISFARMRAIIEIDRRNLQDRKSTRLNSSHVKISYAVFCLKKKKEKRQIIM